MLRKPPADLSKWIVWRPHHTLNLAEVTFKTKCAERISGAMNKALFCQVTHCMDVVGQLLSSIDPPKLSHKVLKKFFCIAIVRNMQSW